MKIVIFTEGAYEGGKFPRNFNNARTDVAWSIALNADNYSFKSNPYPGYDLGVIIVPKKNPEKAFDMLHEKRNVCKRWATMQEGPHTYYQDWSILEQIRYLNFLQEMDIVFCHNEFDKRYYKGLLPHIKVSILPSLMIHDAIPTNIERNAEKRYGTMIGGTWCSWYSGQDSYFIAQEFEEDIWAPAMGRMNEEELQIQDIRYMPYMNWSQWMEELSKMKYAVHLMRTWAAGTFPLNAAYLGIPCIGWGSNDEKNIHGTDTQRLLFPELTIPLGDMVEARRIAKHLRENQLFYDHVSIYAMKMYSELFSEKIFIEKFKENILGI